MSTNRELLQEFGIQARSVAGTEPLMQLIARRLHEEKARYNWVGFYLMEDSTPKILRLGPYVGSFVPIERIPLDQGLCGAAATQKKTVVANNVQADPRYVGSGMVKSNLVTPNPVKGRGGRGTRRGKLLRCHVSSGRPGIHRVLRCCSRTLYGKGRHGKEGQAVETNGLFNSPSAAACCFRLESF